MSSGQQTGFILGLVWTIAGIVLVFIQHRLPILAQRIEEASARIATRYRTQFGPWYEDLREQGPESRALTPVTTICMLVCFAGLALSPIGCAVVAVSGGNIDYVLFIPIVEIAISMVAWILVHIALIPYLIVASIAGLFYRLARGSAIVAAGLFVGTLGIGTALISRYVF